VFVLVCCSTGSNNNQFWDSGNSSSYDKRQNNRIKGYDNMIAGEMIYKIPKMVENK